MLYIYLFFLADFFFSALVFALGFFFPSIVEFVLGFRRLDLFYFRKKINQHRTLRKERNNNPSPLEPCTVPQYMYFKCRILRLLMVVAIIVLGPPLPPLLAPAVLQKNREANREAELLLAEEEEEDADVVERDEMRRLNSKRHKAMVEAERERVERERAQRRNICKAMAISAHHRASDIMNAMARTYARGRQEAMWEKEIEAEERARLERENGEKEPIVVSHWGDSDGQISSVEKDGGGGGSRPLENQARPETITSSDSLAVKGPQGSWTVASGPSSLAVAAVGSSKSCGILGKRKTPFVAAFKRRMGKMSAAVRTRSELPPAIIADSDEA